MKGKAKLVVFVMIVCMLVAPFGSAFGKKAEAATTTDVIINKMIATAEKYENWSRNDFLANGYSDIPGQWCVWYVRQLAKDVGVDDVFSKSNNTAVLFEEMTNPNGAYKAKGFKTEKNNGGDCFKYATAVNTSTMDIRPGDILCIASDAYPTMSHVAFVTRVTDSYVYFTDGNGGSKLRVRASKGNSSGTDYHCYLKTVNNKDFRIVGYIRPNYAGSIGCQKESIPSGVKVNESNGSIKIIWDAVDNAKYYALYMKDTSGNVVLVHNRIATNTYSCTVKPDGQKLGFVVKAYANKEWGGYSKTAWVAVSSAVRSPSTVTVTPGTSSATVTWEAVPGAQVYALFMKDASGAVTLIHNRVTDNSYTVNGLTAGQSVGFVVKAYVSRQWSGWSGTSWAKPLEGEAKVYGVLDLGTSGYTSYNVGLNVEMYADKAYPIKNGATLEILGKYTNSKGNEIYHVYSPDLGFECYVSAKYVKVS